MGEKCPLCECDRVKRIAKLAKQPALVGVQWPSRERSLVCSKGDIDLRFCRGCGFIWNAVFDDSVFEYTEAYDNALDYSPLFQDYTSGLVKRLVDTYDIRNKVVVDIGCGKGRFISALCEEGNNEGFGFDPSYEGERWPSEATDRIEYTKDLYSEKYADLNADLVCSRFVFEHIQKPMWFLDLVKRTICSNPHAVVFFEVPNVRLILEDFSPWDVIYEHCSYFSVESLRTAFEKSGFTVLRIEETYGGQFIVIEAKLSDETDQFSPRSIEPLAELVKSFSKDLEGFFHQWQSLVAEWKSLGKSVVVWGAGAKAVGFLNMLNDISFIEYVVDINPHKRGKFLAGTGQRVISPEEISKVAPDVVLLMNPIYREEVSIQLRELCVEAELVNAI